MKITNETFLGKIVRLPLRLIPRNLTIRILFGRMRGYRWIIGSGVHGYWLGIYEPEMQNALASLVHWGDVVYDVGAHVGFFSLLVSRIVGSTGRVYAFEPSPENIHYLTEHKRLNAADNLTICPFAVGDKNDSVHLAVGHSSSTGRISDHGIPVSMRTLDEFVASGSPLPQVIKIDVEASDLEVLLGAKNLLEKNHPVIVGSLDSRALAHLKSIGYVIEQLIPNVESEVIARYGSSSIST